MDTYPPPSERVDTCVDIGSNVGAFSIPMSNYCEKIISIEPFKENYDYMVSKIEHYGIDNIIPINKAISPKSGEMVEMRVSSEESTSGDITCSKLDGEGYTSLGSVETISLNDIINEHGEIDYMKVDCEGCEWDLLYNKDLSKIKMIVIEIHSGFIGKDKRDKLVNYLTSEFTHKYVYHQEYKYAKTRGGDYEDPRLASMEDSEFIFRREGTPKYEDNIYIKFRALNKPNGPIQREWLKNIKRYV